MAQPAIHALGDAALVLEFGSGIEPALNARVLAAWRSLQAASLPGVLDLVPAYATLTVFFDPCAWRADALAARLLELAAHEVPAPPARMVEIPVCYEAPFATDLEAVCAHTGLGAAELVQRHTGAAYRVYFLGFTPGFPYLGGLDPALAVPRRPTPRLAVPAGSVAIGGEQTGIYPMQTPGGWHIIGRTPLRLFDAAAERPCLLAPGDSLRFVAIGAAEFARLASGEEGA